MSDVVKPQELNPVTADTEKQEPPKPGFERHFRPSPFTAPWEPIWSKRMGDVIHMGVIAAPAHCNSRGLVHGALLTALADNAMGLSCAIGQGERQLVTVNLGIDFVASARQGQWVEVQPCVVRHGSSLCFASALIFADGMPCARANGTFRVVASPSP